MLLANSFNNSALKKVHLKGVRAMPTEDNLGFQPYVTVTPVEPDDAALDLFYKHVNYQVRINFSLFSRRNPTKYISVSIKRFEKNFLLDAGVNLFQTLRNQNDLNVWLDMPAQYLCGAIATIIAARSELVVSTRKSGAMDIVEFELVCHLPKEVRKQKKLREHPRMEGWLSLQDCKDFYRPVKKTPKIKTR